MAGARYIHRTRHTMKELLHATSMSLLLMLVSSGLGAAEAHETDLAPPGLNLALPRQNWADRSNLSPVWPTRPSEAQLQHLPYGSGYEMRRGQRAESGISQGGGAAPMERHGAGRGR